MTYTDKEIEAAAHVICCPDGCHGGHGSGCIAYQVKHVARAALDAVPREPEGCRLVPVEISDKMVDALNGFARCAGFIQEGYRAMLSAAPRYGERK